MAEGVLAHIRAIKIPDKETIVASYRDARSGIQKVRVNTINVRFYETGSSEYVPTKGLVYHFSIASILKIEVPEALGWILLDDSIETDRVTHERWVGCRQDYICTLNANRRIADSLTEAMVQFPEIPEDSWYLAGSIRGLPVKQVIIKRNKLADKVVKDAISKELPKNDLTKSLVDMIDGMSSEVNITTRLLHDIPDMVLVQGLNEQEVKGGFILVIVGVLIGALSAMAFMIYAGA